MRQSNHLASCKVEGFLVTSQAPLRSPAPCPPTGSTRRPRVGSVGVQVSHGFRRSEDASPDTAGAQVCTLSATGYTLCKDRRIYASLHLFCSGDRQNLASLHLFCDDQLHSTTSSRRSDPWLPSPPPPPGLSALAPAGSMPPHTTPLPTPRPRPLRPGTRRQHASAHHASPPAGATPVLRVLTSSTPHQCRSPPPVCLHMTAQRHALVFRRTRPTDVNLQEVSRFSHSEPPLYHAFSLAPIPTSLPAAHSQPSSSATAWQAQPQPIARSNASSSAPRPQPEP